MMYLNVSTQVESFQIQEILRAYKEQHFQVEPVQRVSKQKNY